MFFTVVRTNGPNREEALSLGTRGGVSFPHPHRFSFGLRRSVMSRVVVPGRRVKRKFKRKLSRRQKEFLLTEANKHGGVLRLCDIEAIHGELGKKFPERPIHIRTVRQFYRAHRNHRRGFNANAIRQYRNCVNYSI